jgi:hypothetical protein
VYNTDGAAIRLSIAAVFCCRIVQLAERLTLDQKVLGSNPSPAATVVISGRRSVLSGWRPLFVFGGIIRCHLLLFRADVQISNATTLEQRKARNGTSTMSASSRVDDKDVTESTRPEIGAVWRCVRSAENRIGQVF